MEHILSFLFVTVIRFYWFSSFSFLPLLSSGVAKWLTRIDVLVNHNTFHNHMRRMGNRRYVHLLQWWSVGITLFGILTVLSSSWCHVICWQYNKRFSFWGSYLKQTCFTFNIENMYGKKWNYISSTIFTTCALLNSRRRSWIGATAIEKCSKRSISMGKFWVSNGMGVIWEILLYLRKWNARLGRRTEKMYKRYACQENKIIII